MKELFSIKQLHKTYTTSRGTTHALRGIDLSIMDGEIFSLLGVNGAGKTTLSSILATIHPATSGVIEFAGVPISLMMNDYRCAIGFCPQKPNFLRNLTVEENMYHAGRCFGLNAHEARDRTAYVIEKFELGAYVQSQPWTLSGGYQQRVLLARSLVHNPQVLILDEPTVGLDPHIRRHIWSVIKELKQQGMTIILTTHYLDEAEQLSDRVCILDKGSIKLIETPQNLMKQHESKTLEEVFIRLMEEEQR